MSVKSAILEALSDMELTELAWEQAALTTALAERLEMVARDIQDLLCESGFNQSENANERRED